MTIMSLVNDIGSDADLLTRSDAWLERERRQIAAQMDKLANELRPIMAAQRIKSMLQQENKVAVQQIIRDDKGDINDIHIKLVGLPDAIKLVNSDKTEIGTNNAIAQCVVWGNDGYDVDTSAQMRQ